MAEEKKASPYGWSAVILCSLMIFVALGFCSSAKGIYVIPITQGLGISRSAYSLMTTVRYITMVIVNVFFGSLVQRMGTKRLILTGFCFLIIYSLIYSIANGMFLLLVGSVFLGAGLSFTSTTMVGAVINSSCPYHTGTFLGAALAMNGVGAAAARVILTPIVYGEDPLAFRNAFRLVALILLVVGLIMLVFFKDNEACRIEEKREKSSSHSASKMFGRLYLYIALICVFLTGLVLQGVGDIADPHLKDSGLALGFITTAMSVQSVLLSFSKATLGFLYDRKGLRIASSCCYVAELIALPALLFVAPSGVGMGLGMIFAVLAAVAIPLQTVMLPIFVRELFGEAHFQKALGIFVGANSAGYAIGGVVANLLFELTGRYDAWIVIAEVLIAVIFVAMSVAITLAAKARRGDSARRLLSGKILRHDHSSARRNVGKG